MQIQSIYIIINIISLIACIYILFKAHRIKYARDKQKENYLAQLNDTIDILTKEKKLLQQQYNQEKMNYDKQLSDYKTKAQEQALQELNKTQAELGSTIAAARQEATNEIALIKQDVKAAQQSAIEEKNKIQTEINKLSDSLTAGRQAQLRAQQEEEQNKFYTISITDEELDDIKKLQELKKSLHNPTILSKLIWTQYFQKPVTVLCIRVFGTEPVCGIYKITNTITKSVYIGQSVDISTRIKAHCKCGLGIDAPSTNKLYNDMQKTGIWNYTFELLEKCPKELLNEKEAFWINMYHSNQYGLNTTKGNLT